MRLQIESDTIYRSTNSTKLLAFLRQVRTIERYESRANIYVPIPYWYASRTNSDLTNRTISKAQYFIIIEESRGFRYSVYWDEGFQL